MTMPTHDGGISNPRDWRLAGTVGGGLVALVISTAPMIGMAEEPSETHALTCREFLNFRASNQEPFVAGVAEGYRAAASRLLALSISSPTSEGIEIAKTMDALTAGAENFSAARDTKQLRETCSRNPNQLVNAAWLELYFHTAPLPAK